MFCLAHNGHFPVIHSLFQRFGMVAALCLLALLCGEQASAQTITNIASATWQQAGQTVSTASNTVAFSVANLPAITTYTLVPGGTTSLNFTASQCKGAALPGFTGGGASTPTPLAQAQTVQIGSAFYFSVNAQQANLNPNAIDSLQAVVTTTSGDKETVTIYETAPNTGVFVGAMPTFSIPPAVAQGDCRLSVNAGDTVSIAAYIPGQSTPIATSTITAVADPFGFVFDSGDGTPVNGAVVTLINATTGAPAQVFAPDGKTAWPSTVTSGQTITDGGGNPYAVQSGEYRFPVVAPGQYRLRIQPPTPYTAPSTATAQQLAGITRPDGTPVVISGGSYEAVFSVTAGQILRVDVPLDRAEAALTLTKSASRASAQPGDVVFYTVQAVNSDTRPKRSVVLTDRPARQLRIRPDSVRIDGAAAGSAVSFAADASWMRVTLGTMAAASQHTITYAATVRESAQPGQAVNTATTTDALGTTATATATVQILADTLVDRMTIIGRISDGGCLASAPHHGIPGVRVMLEDGSYAITDKDGRYHFDGVVPGDHVAQASRQTLPDGGQFIDCGRSTRSAGSAISRFVSGQGGMLAVADFYAELPPKPASATHDAANPATPVANAGANSGKGDAVKGDAGAGASKGDTGTGDKDKADNAPADNDGTPAVLSDKAAAGGETDWLTLGDGPTDFLFPAMNYNPRSPAIRVIIRHHASQTVALSINGQPAPKVAFDGIKTAPNHKYAVSIWTGVPLDGEKTILTAVVHNLDGSVATTLTREIHFTNAAAQATLMPQFTHLIADGRTRPVIALRITDRNGYPVHSGVSGEVGLNAPYESADAVDGMQTRSLVGAGQQNPHWVVKGDDGIAYVTLAPTMVSGAVHLDLNFDDGGQKRHQTIDGWVVPGDLPWTLVGLAEGSLGSRSIANVMERSGQFDSDLGTHARTAFYAKGRVLGKYLLTVAYDSAKQSADQSLGGAINPNAYYTVFADGSARRFDAASRDKLYVRIESSNFYVMFGDFQTGFNQTQLARYSRALTGVSGEAHLGHLHAQGFAAKTATSHRHLEVQGGGVSGPYGLGNSVVIANSETVSIEVRDRFRSNEVISSTQLTRFIDYDVDLLSNTITFKQPVLSHDSSLNPQYIVIDYDVDTTQATANAMVGGARADYTTLHGHLRVGATAISDDNDGTRNTVAAIDVKAQITPHTELRAEAGASRKNGVTSDAWSIEAEHHDKHFDMMAYAHSAGQNFGTGETSGAELGWRKIGFDAKLRVNDRLSLITSIWNDHSLTDGTDRNAVQVKGEYRVGKATYHIGVSALNDQLPSSTSTTTGTTTNPSGTSTIVDAGLTRKFFHDKLEIDADASIAAGADTSIDGPATDSVTARYALTPTVKLVGSYEIARSGTIKTDTARFGFEMTPWRGAKLSAGAGSQDVAEYGPRSFASFGLAQSLPLGRHLTVDATVDANKVLSGFDANKIVNTDQAVTSGGQLDGSGTLTENFTAVTLGLGWKQGLWSATARGEYRDGEFAKRHGLTFGAIRQLGDGQVMGSGLTITHATGSDGSASSVIDGSVAFVERPTWSNVAILGKLEFRSDYARAATTTTTDDTTLTASTISGVAGTAGDSALSLVGNALSRRVIGSWSINWSPRTTDSNGDFVQRSEVGVFVGIRHNFDKYDGYNLAGTTLLTGLDLHIGLGDRFEVGGSFTMRQNISDHTGSYAIGPSIGFVPAENVLINVGYNITGFKDPDFSASRTTNRGVFASLKLKFDTSTFAFLGLDGRAR